MYLLDKATHEQGHAKMCLVVYAESKGPDQTNQGLHCVLTEALDNIECIMKTHLYNFDPLKPHFYIVKLGYTGVYIIILISAQKHRLWVLLRTTSPKPRQF